MENLERLAIHSITTKPWDLQTAVMKYKDAGVRGISIWKEAYEALGAKKAGQLAHSAGLDVVSLIRGGFFVHPVKEEREVRIARNLSMIHEAAELGAPHIVLVCGAHPNVRIEEARRQVAEGISEILPAAERERIKLAIEPLHPMYAADRSVINTLSEALDLCDYFESSHVGIVVDVYHTWWDPELHVQIERAGRGNRIFAFHVCDWKTPLEDMLEDRGLMGEGNIDIPSIRKTVEKAGFSGFVEVEIFSRRYWALDQDIWLGMIVDSYRKSV